MGGHTLNPALSQLLMEAWAAPFTTKSDFARAHATLIGLAASEGWITTRKTLRPKTYGNVWRVTPKGLRRMWPKGERKKAQLYVPQTLPEQQD